MIGNDVVDLVLAKKESNWKRKGFLNKLFTSFEQELIFNATNQDEMVWMLWSIKESVYKAYQRIYYNEGFYPIKIEVIQINSKNESIIKLFDSVFYGKTTIDKDFIKTIVVLNKSDFNQIQYLNTSNYIKNEKGLPIELHSKKPISISHHGRIREIVGFF
ncbi:4'-phosphopantetheinyl transferase superfamily protein [Flavobacterium sp.]|jgi:phosphopantetheinyl transferase (holo-ACP synthase)|uniref:4'-phosphopantetheinyl transferase family protein n=1 Tax=Flavobacterium sp. TaxID=239 RepID=UPI002A7F3CFF|nr:4'-phosphopantetheinyl transferase superfamily protein [Flavobacterium sp.]